MPSFAYASSDEAFQQHFNHVPIDGLSPAALRAAYCQVRSATEQLTADLSVEDQNLQSMASASPVKWHRAHTSWFFETFVLTGQSKHYRAYDPHFGYLFNSYYNGIGRQYPRAQRGLISRPGSAQVSAYRESVDAEMLRLIDGADEATLTRLGELILLGLNHEQQHQELIVTDLKHAFSANPLAPAWRPNSPDSGAEADQRSDTWLAQSGGLVEIGAEGSGFAFDNERPRHRVWLDDYQLAARPVSCGDYCAFIEDHGYDRPELWLSDGWSWRQAQGIDAPLYWQRIDGCWQHYTLSGLRAVDVHAPICHISFYEAAAFAAWAKARLPTEAEWEHAARQLPARGHFADSGLLHPRAAAPGTGLVQLYGDVWEWTSSSYAPYPGFRAATGAVGEYNGKFMANQMVLRGGSCATPDGHVRASYRNFFYPSDRWQFSGLRLARDGDA